MEGEGNEGPARTGKPEAWTPSKSFLLSKYSEGRTSQEGGAADRLTIGRATEAARGERPQILHQYSQPLRSVSLTAGRGGVNRWPEERVATAALEAGLKATRAGALMHSKQASQ